MFLHKKDINLQISFLNPTLIYHHNLDFLNLKCQYSQLLIHSAGSNEETFLLQTELLSRFYGPSLFSLCFIFANLALKICYFFTSTSFICSFFKESFPQIINKTFTRACSSCPPPASPFCTATLHLSSRPASGQLAYNATWWPGHRSSFFPTKTVHPRCPFIFLFHYVQHNE